MSLFSLFQRRRSAPLCRKQSGVRLSVEALENRCLPALLAPVSYPDTLAHLNAGDFNNDGIADIIGAGKDALNGLVVVRLGNGDGSFGGPLSSPAATSSNGLALGDFNDDGNLDVAALRFDAVKVLLGSGDGTFQAPQTISIPPAVRYMRPFTNTMEMGDVNNDGQLDLVVTGGTLPGGDFYSNSIHVLLGNGDGSFITAYSSSYSGAGKLWLRDFNEDGNLDVLDNFSSVRLLRGNGDGTFQEPVGIGASQAHAGSVADLDGDGHLDFVGSYSAVVSIPPPPDVFLGNGDGTFEVGPSGAPVGVPVDMNGDGFIDIVNASSNNNTVSVSLGNGDGTFQSVQGFLGGTGPSNPVAADLIGDGLPDVAVVNSPFSAAIGFSVLLNDGDWLSSNQPPSLAINDVTVTEGDSGTTSADFTVTLSVASSESVTVPYSTSNAFAAAGSDYLATSGTLIFAPGETAKTISVPILGDTAVESNEVFLVRLDNPTGAIIADGIGAGTIVNDDASLGKLAISDATLTEGNTGTTNAVFTVSLLAASTKTITVDYATADAGTDYVATSGTLTFAPGETSNTVTVQVNGDRLAEPTETFAVNLTAPTNATIGDGQGIGTILDDEPRISISDVSKKEGRKNRTTLFTFTVTLVAAYDQPVTMSFQTVNGTATTSNNDYSAKTGTLTFAPGETSKTITIEVRGDSKREANETFYLDLFGLSSNALFARNRGAGTILNDD